MLSCRMAEVKASDFVLAYDPHSFRSSVFSGMIIASLLSIITMFNGTALPPSKIALQGLFHRDHAVEYDVLVEIVAIFPAHDLYHGARGREETAA